MPLPPTGPIGGRARLPDDNAAAGRAELRSATSLHYVTYEQFESSIRVDTEAFRSVLDAILAEGARTPGGHRVPLVPPVQWTQANRSIEFHLHAWEPLSPLLRGHDLFEDRRYFERALDVALDWLGSHQDRLLAEPRSKALDAAQSPGGGMAWYDMAVGLRAHRLAYIADVVGRDSRYPAEISDRLRASLVFHMDLLARDEFFVGHTNHGLYQALGQMAAAKRFAGLPGFREHLRQSEERLRTMFEHSFFPSGVHREHSPGYHYMILGTLLGARAEGLLTEAMNDLIARAEEALCWMVGPDGVLAPIGDTDPLSRRSTLQTLGRFNDPHLLHLLSDTRHGQPPDNGLKTYADAGFIFIRDAQTYLAQIAGFHSRTHKHADHLSFLWSHAGQEILIDPGRFGYIGRTEVGSDLHRNGHWYADPRRIYVEKTRAHNCVEIDGKDYPRVRTKPFGSAIVCAGKQADLYVTSCETLHFRKIRHRRDLVLRPGDFLLVLDWLYDRSGEAHDFKQWFQVAPQWETTACQQGLAFSDPEASTLWIANLLDASPAVCLRGQTEPEMGGWRSDAAESLVPTTSVHFSARGARAAFATLVLTRRGEPLATTRANQTLSAGRFAWRDDRGDHTVAIRREGRETLAGMA